MNPILVKVNKNMLPTPENIVILLFHCFITVKMFFIMLRV